MTTKTQFLNDKTLEIIQESVRAGYAPDKPLPQLVSELYDALEGVFGGNETQPERKLTAANTTSTEKPKRHFMERHLENHEPEAPRKPRYPGRDPEKHGPAVPIEDSVQPDYVVCLEDGRKMKMLKRHLKSRYGMSPEQYREKWNLSPDHPLTAPNYSDQRSTIAYQTGLHEIHR